MNFHNQIPVELGHLHKADVSENTSIVDDDVYSAKSVDCGLYDFIAEFYRVVVCDSLTSSFLDFINNDISWSLLLCLGDTAYRTTEIVNNDFRTAGGKKMCVNTTETVTGSSYDGDFVVKSHLLGAH